MTEKLKVPQSVADAIEKYKTEQVRLFNLAKQDGQRFPSWGQALEGLEVDDFVSALYNGYEVEEEYKVGDWAKFHHHGDTWIAKIKAIKQGTQTGKDMYLPDAEIHKLAVNRYYHYVETPSPEEIKAEQERRTWAKIGREVQEFRIGDMGVLNKYVVRRSENEDDLTRLQSDYADGELKGFYPAESFISFGGGEE